MIEEDYIEPEYDNEIERLEFELYLYDMLDNMKISWLLL